MKLMVMLLLYFSRVRSGMSLLSLLVGGLAKWSPIIPATPVPFISRACHRHPNILCFV